MAALSFNAIDKTGTDMSSLFVAADAAGDTFPSGNSGIITVKNGDAGSHTVTITPPVATTVAGNFGNQTVETLAIAIPASEERSFSLPSGYASGSLFTLTYDDVTSVTIAGIVANPV
jgi:hypothetical protein